jgi:hypothetical protein
MPGKEKQVVELQYPTGNLADDEGMVRHHLRKELNLKKLPVGTEVDWIRPIS